MTPAAWVALVAVVVLAALAWRRWGPAGAAAAVLGAVTLGLATRRRPRPELRAALDTTERLVASERRRVEAEHDLEEATEARAEVATVDDEGVAEWLALHLHDHRQSSKSQSQSTSTTSNPEGGR